MDGSRVYALSPHGDLLCLDAATGKQLWGKNLPKDFGGQVGGWHYSESVLIDFCSVGATCFNLPYAPFAEVFDHDLMRRPGLDAIVAY